MTFGRIDAVWEMGTDRKILKARPRYKVSIFYRVLPSGNSRAADTSIQVLDELCLGDVSADDCIDSFC